MTREKHEGEGLRARLRRRRAEKFGEQQEAERAEQAQQQAGEYGANDAEDDVHEYTGIGVHDFLGEPAGDTADNDGCDPTYAVKTHCLLLA